MTPEDERLWKRVVDTVVPLGFRPAAAQMGAPAAWEPVSQKVLDLHGMTLNTAHSRTLAFIREAHRLGYKRVIIITGLSGEIRREFPMWIEDLPQVRKSITLSGGGAFEVSLTKSK
jgi:dsDNA-specific endonuclease/ATPase MutS2